LIGPGDALRLTHSFPEWRVAQPRKEALRSDR
jgi:hypothetical protein